VPTDEPTDVPADVLYVSIPGRHRRHARTPQFSSPFDHRLAAISGATGICFVCCVDVFSPLCGDRLSSRPPSEIAETASLAALARFSPEPSCLAPNRPRAKGRSFDFVVMRAAAIDAPIIIVEGNDRGRAALGARTTAHRLRVRVVPRCHAPAQITNTLAGYRTAELSDSPRASVMPPVRPSALLTPAACGSEAVRPSFRPGVSAHIAHCSGRGAPSRVASPARRVRDVRGGLFPLTARPRPAGCKFRSFRQAISVQSGRLFRSKPAVCFGPKRHPFPKAFRSRPQRTVAGELIIDCYSY